MVREDARTKASRLAASGRLDIYLVTDDSIRARVRGDSAGVYFVTWRGGHGWARDCPAWSYRCSHVQAVQLCTVREHDRTEGDDDERRPRIA